VSRVTIASGRRVSQARCLSAFKGLEVPPLLDRARFTYRKEKIVRFFRNLGGVPLLAPEGVSTVMGHSWYSLLTSRP